jgi:hypothetical protein
MVLWAVLVMLLIPPAVQASCGSHLLPRYAKLVEQNRYDDALQLILDDLLATDAEKKKFRIIPDSSGSEAELSISPATLQSGKSSACQKVMASLQRARDRAKDIEQMKSYHEDWEVSESGWMGCPIEGIEVSKPDVAATRALECLGTIGAHGAAQEIHVVVSELDAGDSSGFNDEDQEYLRDQLSLFFENRGALDEEGNASYYIPPFKEEDRSRFCRGVHALKGTNELSQKDDLRAWRRFCAPPKKEAPSAAGG